MRQLLTATARFLLRHTLQFLLFLAILLAGKLLLAEFRQFQSAASDLAALRGVAETLERERGTLSGATTERAMALQRASTSLIALRIAAIDQELRNGAATAPAPLLSFPLPSGAGVLAHFRHAAETELLRQERDYLQLLKIAISLENARQKLVRLRQEHVSAYQALQANLQAQQQWTRQHPLAAYLPGSAPYEHRSQLQDDEARLRAANLLAWQQFRAQQTIIDNAPFNQAPAFAIDQTRVASTLQPLHDAIRLLDTEASRNWIARASAPVKQLAPAAALLVLSAVLTPLLIKALFYFVLAPLASRVKPVRIAPDAHGLFDASAPEALSAVSKSVPLQATDVMLIHPEYLQASSPGTQKNTKWLLDWRFPLTSLAAGMVLLTRIRATRPERVTISASDDPLSEIALLTLPDGCALVFQPRGLVGVVHRQDQPLRIESRWRLASLHAWLTLQLRYIVLRGPATLIVRGCRGVRIEAAGDGRSISQAATLGFSANLAYSTMRSETFLPYLMGKQALLNDRFDGDAGFYIYEETPRHGKQPGKAGNFFEGFTDAMLKVFGI